MGIRSKISLLGVVTAAMGAAVVACLFITNPRDAGALVVTIWFIALGVTLHGVFTLLIFALKSRREQPKEQVSKRLVSSWRQGVLIAFGLTIFAALSSLQQLGIRDVAIITALLILVEFYLRTRG
jgi:hypothetical protein